jgi:hypothetical protein
MCQSWFAFMSTILGLLPFLAAITVAFGCGYGLREYIARRRRTAARDKFYRDHPDYAKIRGVSL